MNKVSSRFTPINDSDPDCDRTVATLAIYHIDPILVTQKLNLVPTGGQKKGFPKVMRSGKTEIGTIDSWLLSSENHTSSKDVRKHLNWLLDQIEPVAKQLKELQQLPEVKMTIWCVWWSASGGGGPTLWPEQMERMGKFNLECNFSFAHYDEENN